MADTEYSGQLSRHDRPDQTSAPVAVAMNPNEMFNWPDGDVILRATHDTETRDFRVHKLFLSFSSPVFKDMFKIPQPPSDTWDGVETVDVPDPPRALELILRFIYPSPTSPVVDDLAALSEDLVLADKYDVEVARVRLRASFVGFAKTEPLRAFAIACRFGLTEEMKIASSHTTSIHLPSSIELPDEFKSIPATEYHRLVRLHSRYREEVEAIADRTPLQRPFISNVFDLFVDGGDAAGRLKSRETAKQNFRKSIKEGVPLNQESLVKAWKADGVINPLSDPEIQTHISSILSQASGLNLTV